MGAKSHLAVSPLEFSQGLERLGPFERAPRLAVACSGGPDSMTLVKLAQGWVNKNGGAIAALIVDHRLRDDSTEEAKRVLNWLTQWGVDARILTRSGARPASNLQAHAREARYRLLIDWCRNAGCLHLLLGHHGDDQVETIRMREARGSGADGLAGMAPILEYADVRLLRPLLPFPKTRVKATVEALKIPSVDDPSNTDTRFDRVRIRRLLATDTGRQDGDLSREQRCRSTDRKAREIEMTALLANACDIYPEGYAILDPRVWNAAPDSVGSRALSGLCTAIGGRRHPPHRQKVERLQDAIRSASMGGGRTLAGCRITPNRDKLMIYRETALIEEPIPLRNQSIWDGRFSIKGSSNASGNASGSSSAFTVGKLGMEGLRRLRIDCPSLSMGQVPQVVCATLPAIWGLEGVYHVPHLSYSRKSGGVDGPSSFEFRYAPIRPLQATRFTL